MWVFAQSAVVEGAGAELMRETENGTVLHAGVYLMGRREWGGWGVSGSDNMLVREVVPLGMCVNV